MIHIYNKLEIYLVHDKLVSTSFSIHKGRIYRSDTYIRKDIHMRRCKRRMMGTDYKRGPDEIDRTPTGTKVERILAKHLPRRKRAVYLTGAYVAPYSVFAFIGKVISFSLCFFSFLFFSFFPLPVRCRQRAKRIRDE